MKNGYLVQLHLHTSDTSRCGHDTGYDIAKACKEAGSKWYIVEQDTCQRHPMDSLAISLAHLKEWDLD